MTKSCIRGCNTTSNWISKLGVFSSRESYFGLSKHLSNHLQTCWYPILAESCIRGCNTSCNCSNSKLCEFVSALKAKHQSADYDQDPRGQKYLLQCIYICKTTSWDSRRSPKQIQHNQTQSNTKRKWHRMPRNCRKTPEVVLCGVFCRLSAVEKGKTRRSLRILWESKLWHQLVFHRRELCTLCTLVSAWLLPKPDMAKGELSVCVATTSQEARLLPILVHLSWNSHERGHLWHRGVCHRMDWGRGVEEWQVPWGRCSCPFRLERARLDRRQNCTLRNQREQVWSDQKPLQGEDCLQQPSKPRVWTISTIRRGKKGFTQK